MREPEEQRIALECLRIAAGDIEHARSMLAFITNRDEQGVDACSGPGRAGPVGAFDVECIREIAATAARVEIDADAVWHSEPGNPQSHRVRRIDLEERRQFAMLTGGRERT